MQTTDTAPTTKANRIEQFMAMDTVTFRRELRQAKQRAAEAEQTCAEMYLADAVGLTRKEFPDATAIVVDIDEDDNPKVHLVEGANGNKLWFAPDDNTPATVHWSATLDIAYLVLDAYDCTPGALNEIDAPKHDGWFNRYRIDIPTEQARPESESDGREQGASGSVNDTSAQDRPSDGGHQLAHLSTEELASIARRVFNVLEYGDPDGGDDPGYEWDSDTCSHIADIFTSYRAPVSEIGGTTVAAKHDCGMCDGPLIFSGTGPDGVAGWRCPSCGWTHTSQNCCE